jgi:hypothetical protein
VSFAVGELHQTFCCTKPSVIETKKVCIVKDIKKNIMPTKKHLDDLRENKILNQDKREVQEFEKHWLVLGAFFFTCIYRQEKFPVLSLLYTR